MKVYLVECGVYAERYIEGIYATPEAAMAANPISDYEVRAYPGAGWRQEGEGAWSNGCDMGALATVEAFEVQPEGDEGA